MLDLNVDVLSVDSTYHGTEAKIEIVKLSQPSGTMSEDTGTSSSSVVNADDSPASAGDENSSSTQTRTYASALSFDIVHRGTAMKDDDVKNKLYLNSVPELVTKQFFPVAGEGGVADSDEFTSRQPLTAGLLRPKWLNLSVPESGAAPVLRIFDQPKPQAPQPPPQVRKSRRGPRSRSSEYRGVTFYRRTGRWESHIWDCGKQVYLGGFDTAHAAARAYDRAAIKFRGVDADINFHISDYDEDMQQTKNLSKDEFVHVLRRQSTGFARGSSRYRGVTVQKCGRWEARMGQLLGKKAYDKAAVGCNGQEAVTTIDSSTYQGELTLVANDGDSNHNLDLGLWVSPPQDARKGNVNVKDLRLHPAPYQLPDGKRLRVDSSMTAALGGQTLNALHYPIPQAKYPGYKPNYEEEGVIGRREGEAISSLGFSKWAWEMQQQGHHNNSNSIMMSQVAPPYTSTSSSNNTNAASSGFPSFPNPLQHKLIPTKNIYHQTYLPYNHKT